MKPKSPTIRSSRRGSQNPSDLYVITLPSRIPALSWNMPVRNNQLNYRIKSIFTLYSRSLKTISLNNKRINSCLSLFHCSIYLKILQFVWFIANCAWSSLSPLLICSTCHRLYPSSTFPLNFLGSCVVKTSHMISFVHLLAGSNIAKKHLWGQRPVSFAFHCVPGIVHNFMHLKRLDLILPLMLWTSYVK